MRREDKGAGGERKGGEWGGVRRSGGEGREYLSTTKSNNHCSNLSCFFFALSVHCAGSGCDQYERGGIHESMTSQSKSA